MKTKIDRLTERIAVYNINPKAFRLTRVRLEELERATKAAYEAIDQELADLAEDCTREELQDLKNAAYELPKVAYMKGLD